MHGSVIDTVHGDVFVWGCNCVWECDCAWGILGMIVWEWDCL